MKKLLVLAIIIIIALSCDAQTPRELAAQNGKIDTSLVIVPGPNMSKVNQVVTRILLRAHYKRSDLNDSLSSVIMDNYISALDNNKLYFLEQDIKDFEIYRNMFDDYLNEGILDPPFEIFNVFKERMNERMNYAISRIKKGFDFTVDEYFSPDREDTTWAVSVEELNEIWRKRLKNDALNLKLNEKDKDGITETLTKRYEYFHKIILQYKDEDVFQIYMNAFSESIDPHTAYFSPITSDNFKISMSLSLEGIGAQLTMKNDYTTIAKIIPGGPADKSGLLHNEDRIVSVGQGRTGELIDVVGWRLDDVVQLIRGEKGSEVRLMILEANANVADKPKEIILTRDEVKLEEQAAKKKVIDIQEQGKNFKLGVIELPSFYVDFEAQRKGDPDFKSTTKDVKKLLRELKNEKVDGIIVDLRNNGGGSLQEAIDLTGLFIKTGPVVQVRNSNGSIEVGQDFNDEIVYDGPLAVMVNRYSASASEIFGGAIQDYGRGLIIGEQTYGKGTVQNLLPLERFIPVSGDKLGEVKITVAKFYRVTGSSTQHVGVVPDIEYPSPYDPSEYGESSQPSALPWDQIATSDFKQFDDYSKFLPAILEKHKKRIQTNTEFQYLLEDYAYSRSTRDKKYFSLREDVRRKEREESESKRKLRQDERARLYGLELGEVEEVKTENLNVDDPLLEESGHILANLILLKTD